MVGSPFDQTPVSPGDILFCVLRRFPNLGKQETAQEPNG